MGITVKQLCDRFSEIQDYELKQLVGKSNFSDNDVIPLNNFAECSKIKYKTFAAEREGQGFIKLLKGSQQVDVARNAGVTLQPENTHQNVFTSAGAQRLTSFNPAKNSSSPFSQSLFTMKKAV